MPTATSAPMDVKVTVTNEDEVGNGNPVEDPATSWYSGNGERY